MTNLVFVVIAVVAGFIAGAALNALGMQIRAEKAEAAEVDATPDKDEAPAEAEPLEERDVLAIAMSGYASGLTSGLVGVGGIPPVIAQAMTVRSVDLVLEDPLAREAFILQGRTAVAEPEANPARRGLHPLNLDHGDES